MPKAPAAAQDDALPARLSHRDYHSFWTTQESPGWRDWVLDQASTWLRDRIGLDIDLSANAALRNKDRSKRAQVLYRNSGKDHGVRLRVWNSNRDGTFVVTVLAVE